MATIPVLDTNRAIIELTKEMNKEMQRTGAPSPYFEELWYTLTKFLEEVDARLVAGGL